MAFVTKMLAARAMAATLAFAGMAGFAWADDAASGYGQPTPWQTGFQQAATPVMEDIRSFHSFVLPIVTIVTVFVAALLLIVIFRFNHKANPVASKVTHHTWLEVAWTVGPILILVMIAIPSFRLLFEEQIIPKADLTIKATGHQWYWTYEWPDDKSGVSFDANIIADKDLKPGQPRLLAVDNEVEVPVNKIVRVQVTGQDVIHSFAIPSFGIKIDAVPGRLNETWFKATREGVYYGQCSELCGTRHAYMPIQFRVVSQEDYDKWFAQKKADALNDSPNPNKVASAAAITN